MPVDEFMATQDHPLIRAVLTKLYASAHGNEEALVSPTPLVEMVQDGVQWPNREPYPTYFGQMVSPPREDSSGGSSGSSTAR